MPDPRMIMLGEQAYDPRTPEARALLRGYFPEEDWEAFKSALVASRTGGEGDPLGVWQGMQERILKPLMSDERGYVAQMMDFMAKGDDPRAPRFSEVQDQIGLMEILKKQMEEKKKTAEEAGVALY